MSAPISFPSPKSKWAGNANTPLEGRIVEVGKVWKEGARHMVKIKVLGSRNGGDYGSNESLPLDELTQNYHFLRAR